MPDTTHVGVACCFEAASGHPAPPIDGDSVAFVEDITVPDGSLVAAGEPFVKSWDVDEVSAPSRRRAGSVAAVPPAMAVRRAQPTPTKRAVWQARARRSSTSASWCGEVVDGEFG